MSRLHLEHHATGRVGWLRAAVLGANDGIVSTASLIVGVAAAGSGPAEIIVAGLAGLVAGALSMAAGEYVSVSSQSDAERADLAKETAELRDQAEAERRELAEIYEKRGLDPELALKVADQLTAADALGAHARDELGISDLTAANPLQAALTSAATFAAGAAVPLIVAVVAPPGLTIALVAAAALVSLAALGALGARGGGAPVIRATARVVFWGALALAITAGIGAIFGIAA